MERWDAWMAGLAEVLGPLLLTVPPKIASRKPSDLLDQLRLAWRYRGVGVRTLGDVTRLMTMSIADLLDDWFESPQVKGAMAVNGVIGTWAGPYEPGTAYVMAHHSIGDVGDGHLGNWGFPEGGMGAVADAIVRSARKFGADIRTEAGVERLLVRDGSARGGARGRRGDHRPHRGHHPAPEDRLPRPHPRTELPADFVATSSAGRPAAVSSRSTWPWVSCPTSSPTPAPTSEHHTGSVEMAPTMEFIERAFLDAREGRPAVRPFSDSVIPTTFDKTLTPEGIHIMSMFTQWVPPNGARRPTARSSRPMPTGSSIVTTSLHRTSRAPSFTATSSVPTRWSTSTDWWAGTSSTVSSRWSSCSTCGRPRLRRLPDPARGALLRQFGHPRRRRGLRHPGLAGGPGGPGRPAGRAEPSPDPGCPARRWLTRSRVRRSRDPRRSGGHAGGPPGGRGRGQSPA